MSFFEKFFPAKTEGPKKEENPETPKSKKGPYRESEIVDPDELKEAREQFLKSGKFWKVGDFLPEDGIAKATTKTEVKIKGQKEIEIKEFLIDSSGKAISEKFKRIGPFKEGLARVDKGDRKFGFMNKRGEIIGGRWFCGVIDSFGEGLAAVNKNGRHIFINKDMETVLDGFEKIGTGFSKEGERIQYIKEGVDGKVSYVRGRLKKIEGGAWVKKDGKWIAIDKTGKMLMTFEDSIKK
jgi:hypothetical protein